MKALRSFKKWRWIRAIGKRVERFHRKKAYHLSGKISISYKIKQISLWMRLCGVAWLCSQLEMLCMRSEYNPMIMRHWCLSRRKKNVYHNNAHHNTAIESAWLNSGFFRSCQYNGLWLQVSIHISLKQKYNETNQAAPFDMIPLINSRFCRLPFNTQNAVFRSKLLLWSDKAWNITNKIH